MCVCACVYICGFSYLSMNTTKWMVCYHIMPAWVIHDHFAVGWCVCYVLADDHDGITLSVCYDHEVLLAWLLY